MKFDDVVREFRRAVTLKELTSQGGSVFAVMVRLLAAAASTREKQLEVMERGDAELLWTTKKREHVIEYAIRDIAMALTGKEIKFAEHSGDGYFISASKAHPAEGWAGTALARIREHLTSEAQQNDLVVWDKLFQLFKECQAEAMKLDTDL